jgi:peptidoglycan hydrolase CwlO-like protein
VWPLAISLVLILIITVVNKIDIEDSLLMQSKERERTLSRATESVIIISKKLEDIKYNIDKHMFSMENKIENLKHNNELHSEKQYRELARKILDIENKVNSSKKTLEAVFGNLDDRLQRVEDKTI